MSVVPFTASAQFSAVECGRLHTRLCIEPEKSETFASLASLASFVTGFNGVAVTQTGDAKSWLPWFASRATSAEPLVSPGCPGAGDDGDANDEAVPDAVSDRGRSPFGPTPAFLSEI